MPSLRGAALLWTGLFLAACGSNSATSSGSADNVAACQALASVLPCGPVVAGTPLDCPAYASVACDLSPYLACMATKYVCVDGQYDPTALATASTCASLLPAGCTAPVLPAGGGGVAGSAATLAPKSSVEIASVGAVDAPAGDLFVAVDFVLTNTGTVNLPLLPALFHPDRWLLWLGLAFVLAVYFAPTGIVGALKGGETKAN